MGRLERFREYRRIRRNLFLIFLLFIVILFVGLCTVDYSVNYIMNNRKQLSIVAFKQTDQYYELSIMNRKIYLDVAKLRTDMEKIGDFWRSVLDRIFSKRSFQD